MPCIGDELSDAVSGMSRKPRVRMDLMGRSAVLSRRLAGIGTGYDCSTVEVLMRPKRPFWQESDSSASLEEEPCALLPDNARGQQQAIGVELRQLHQKVIDEPVPAERLDLLGATPN